MTDKGKVKKLERIFIGDIDWMASYRKTFQVKSGIGLPSGITGSEAKCSLARRVLKGEDIILVSPTRSNNSNQRSTT